MKPVLQVPWQERAGQPQWQLARRELLVLRDAGGWSLHCTGGRLWLSESDGREEILLPGRVYRITRQGDTVISAQCDGSFSARPKPTFNWLERLRGLCSIPFSYRRHA